MKKRFLLCFIIIALTLSSCAKSPGQGAEKPVLIAHAGGAVYGYRLTNSLQALDSSYKNGFRCFELDFELTSDEQVVLIHDWDSMANRMLLSPGIRTHAQFMSSATFQNLTVLDLDMLLSWLKKHPDSRIITDVKADNLQVLEKLANAAGAQQKLFIPQIYGYEEYEKVRALGFEDVILTLYAMDTDESTLSAFVASHSLWALTIPPAELNERLTERRSAQGVTIYTHGINDLSFYEQWHSHGLYGIYTDYFYPNRFGGK